MVLNCFICNFDADNKESFEKHINTEEHKAALVFKKANITDKDCSKCLRKFCTKNYKNKHELKCKSTLLNSNECEFCNKIFLITDNEEEHKKLCEKNPVNIISENPYNIKLFNIDLSAIKTDSNVKRNAFGEENLQYMTHEDERKFIKRCVKNGFKGFMYYIQEVFLNEKHPENNTIRKTTENFTEIFDGEKWCIVSDNVALQKLNTAIQDNLQVYLFKSLFYEKIKQLESMFMT
jgi:hypothetical protein